MTDAIEALLRRSPAERAEALRALSRPQRSELNERWWRWAHAGQHAPEGDWRIWLIRAGRGFGKTRAGAEWVSAMARADAKARIALVNATADEVRRVMVEGESGLLAVARDGETIDWRPSAGELEFASGARAYIYSAAAPDSLRGPAHHFAWCDELAKWPRGDETWNNLSLGVRLGDRPRVLVTTTPRATALMRRLMTQPGLVETRGRTRDNANLPASFLEDVLVRYAGTRLGRQELDGELLDDIEGALWTRGLIERARCDGPTPAMRRVVVGVDPPAGIGRDACGIVAVGLAADGVAHVIEDASVVGASPAEWARAVAGCAARVGADCVVVEVNNGGAMVASVLRAADAALPLREVHAAEGKSARAEPVSMLYERGLVRHQRAFPALEDELCGMLAGGGYEGPGRSPDRADALVWAMTELMLGRRGQAALRAI